MRFEADSRSLRPLFAPPCFWDKFEIIRHRIMKRRILFSPLVLLACTKLGSTAPTHCLQGCTCDRTSESPTIICHDANMTHFPLPITNPKTSFNFLQLTCNDIRTVPDLDLIMQSFPDLHGIDFQGNPHLNCTSLEQFARKLAILSDCHSSEKLSCQKTPTPASKSKNSASKFCDGHCQSAKKMGDLWKDIKQFTKKFNVKQVLNDFFDYK
ncbi:hypothetical protein B9Z55_026298 [Caenorhabditis nigoni]|uniref:LRRNT domain-containing protein n=1 Tax=Caenorhabditis nigoni TaxID=1611254 RepID=A0A2G5T2N9_9PELO|nr:hypothetical protein B9Z55_026298 [Caenorhabditis nigoni]